MGEPRRCSRACGARASKQAGVTDMDLMSGTMGPVAIQTDTTSVSFNWHLFSGAYTGIDEPLSNAVDAELGNMIGYVNPTLKVPLTIYIIWIALQTHWVPTGAPISGLISQGSNCTIRQPDPHTVGSRRLSDQVQTSTTK
jgi:hypothetical protein